jgi:hypothetical protein
MIVQKVLALLQGSDQDECTGKACPVEVLRCNALDSPDEVHYAVAEYPLGHLLLAAYESEPCAVITGMDEISLTNALQELYPRARLRSANAELRSALELTRDLVCF